MKKYKQVVAALLAMNLTVYVMPTGVINISAAVESQGDEDTTEEVQTNSAENTDAVSAEGDLTADTDVSDNTENTETPASDTTDENVNNNGDTTDTEHSGDAASSEEQGTDDLFSDGTQQDQAAAAATAEQPEEVSEVATQASSDGKIDLEQLSNYNSSTKTMTISSNQELILLSNCDQEQVADINIAFVNVGEVDVTESSKISAGEDISKYFKETASAASSEAQQPVDVSQSEEPEQTDSEEVQETENPDAADTADIQDTDTVENDENITPSEDSAESTEDTSGNAATVATQSVFAEKDYTYQGIGDAEHPFRGTISGTTSETFRIDNALFGGLSSKAKITTNNKIITWCGTDKTPMLAKVYQFDSAPDEGQDSHTIPVDKMQGDSSATMGSLIGTVKASTGFETQVLKIGAGTVTYGSNVKATSASGNSGLICETLESGTICLDSYAFPNSAYTVQSTASYDSTDTSAAGNAGGVIGVMKNGTTLDIKSAINIKNATVTSTNGNAGGIVGLMQQGATIRTEEGATATLKNPAITGSATAGGVAGWAVNTTFDDRDITAAIIVTTPTITANASAASAGGFAGKYTLNTGNLGDATDLKFPEQVTINTPTLTVNSKGLAGGYFGHLDLNGNLTYTIGGADSNTKKEVKPAYKDCNARDLGGIAGKVTNTAIAGMLVIQNMTVNANKGSDTGLNYLGGLVGELGEAGKNAQAVYLKVSNSDVNVSNPQVADDGTNGFGGIAGVLANGSILKTENTVKITASGINRGGGIAGYAEKSVIDLSGTTDLSGVVYNGGSGKNANTGWLVRQQDCALIYAEGDGNGNGWSYIRGKENTSGKTAMNDIGNYGQIIRLHSKDGTSESEQSKLASDLISIDENHNVQYRSGTEVSISGDEITVDSENSFARLSIAWNTRGYFGGVEGIKSSDFFSTGNPRSKNITLKGDIDLTGSGITGLSRDTYSDEDTYIGIFDGNGKEITLSIGETFGYKNSTELAETSDDAQGKVISAAADKHGRQGLFAKVSGATLKNLTIAGNINISNGGAADILVGGIAGELADAKSCQISGVAVEEMITADCSNSATNTGVMAGGFFGGVYNNDASLILGTSDDASTLNTAAAKISLKNFADKTVETRINAGGVIGEVGESDFTFKANCLKVQGFITTEAKKKAYVGGLIGVIEGNYDKNNVASPNHKIEIKDVTFDGFKISADTATDMCGGLFGSIWANVDMYFSGNTQEKPGLNVTSATIQAQNAASVGGLAYRSSGRWEIQDYGIKLGQLSIDAKKDVGLLVCRGESNNDTIATGNRAIGALYLNTTKYWETSYQITQSVSIDTTDATGVFDEFVAYTTPSAAEISDNDKNGVISIATQDNGNGGRVGVDVSACTTYQNRTEYGKTHQTNACSRYYYDLDQCLTDMVTGGTANKSNNNKYIDTPQELMLWSVRYYACKNIKEFFEKINNNQTVPDVTTKKKNNAGVNLPWYIGYDSKIVELNMQKYSYYPIKYTDSSINVWFANIKFCNMEIEQCEQNQKSTQGTSKNHTQHYTMHCGLLLNYQPTPGNLNVTRVTFSGSIGKVNNSTSGALIANIANGSPTSPRVTTITINSLTFDNLKVNNCGDGYAPLLINSITHNVTLNANNITTKINGKDTYTGGTAVASSLIGTTGTKKAKRLNMTFQNIVLPDKKAEGSTGIFSHATLLESFSYDENDNTSGASYNFYKADDWSDTTHKHEVTYGQEITETTEYPNFQKWYYDEDTYGNAAGLVYDNSTDKSFSATAYLKYVCEGYNKEECKHEIRVNQRVTNIIHGCGTYGHPYQITTEKEMEILSEYMATGTARKDWRVTITRDQSAYHQTAVADKCDATYQFNGSNYWELVENKGTNGKDDWKVVDGATKLTNDFMLQYLLNAYYDIQGAVPSDPDKSSVQEHQLNLTDFGGFGSVSNPFRGVLTSSTGATIVLSGEQTGNGLIPYSYGSVIKNLKISYQKSGKTLTYNTKTDVKYYPKQTECFGGVIGCVLGGDNIIEGVSVSMGDGWLTLSREKSHLIQVGGYVGTVSGGGVIFRNMTDGTGLKDEKITNNTNINPETETTYSDLYINPYVGRVMDGFVFYEKTSADSGVVPEINNTDKNYKINTLDTSDTDCITISGNNVNVDNAQGLLILSAIINSGAASDGNSVSYSSVSNEKNKTTAVGSDKKTYTYNFAGAYGKVRNASYDKIGEETEEGEVTLSKTDDQTVPGADSLPYLIKKYCKTENDTEKAFKISVNSDVEINLPSKGTFDMSVYGNGYQGIGARYVSNAVRCDANGDKRLTCKPEGIVPELNKFNGNNSTVILNMQVREYADDDFHAASVGGMFNILRMKKDDNNNGEIKDLTITQSGQGGISLKYYNLDGEISDIDNWNYKENVGVGGFAGSVTGYVEQYDTACDFTFNNIQLNNLNVTSPANAGGIIGNSGKVFPNNRKDQTNYIPTDIAVLLQPENGQYTYGIAFNNCNYTDLTVTGKYTAGGFAGCIANAGANPRSSVNGNGFDGGVTKEIIGESSTISATDNSSSAGGLFGYIGTRMFINMTDEGTEKTNKAVLKDVKVSAGKSSGGCIGYIDGKCYGIHNVTVKGTETSAVKVSLPEKTSTGEYYAGGIIGYAKGTGQRWTPNWSYAGGISGSSVENVEINDAAKAETHDNSGPNKIKTNYIAGGIVGQTAGGPTRIEGSTVTNSKVYGSVAGGITGQTDSEMQFISCATSGTSEKKTELKGFSTAGGILGFWTGGNAATIQDCAVQYLDIEGKDWGVGALIGDADGGGVGTLYLFNSSAQNSNVTASGDKDNGGGRWPCVGAIVGNLRNTIKASNILFSGVELAATKGKYSAGNGPNKGLLFGTVTSNDSAVNIAGISIQNIPLANQTWNLTGGGSVSADNDYIAFADYSGTALDDSQKGSSADLLVDNSTNDVAEPYVVTSPKNSTLKLYESESSETPKYLYGDGAYWSSVSGNGMEAKEIWDSRTAVTDGHYAYKKIMDNGNNSVSDFKFDSAISTYSANNPTTESDSGNTDQTTQGSGDFPVIQIGVGSADTVKDYLNILTNGAFSAANSMNTAKSSYVTANVDVYQEVNGKFVKQENAKPTFTASTDSAGKITFSTTTGYDNGKNRFNLLTVTFTEKDASGIEHHYNVQVPVLVRRMLEINFSATLSYGTNFREDNYENLRSHVLESFGSSITAYLKYTYNSDEKENYTEYGWQSYIDAGGDVSAPMKRELCFKQGSAMLPTGTQLSLVDCRDGKVYYYTVDDPTQNVDLTAFKDSDGNAYNPPSIAELMKATAKSSSDGTFIKVDENGKPNGGADDKDYSSPTVRIWNSNTNQYEYYRRAESGETGQYTISVDESKLKDSNNKSTVSESYYLVITVPKDSTSGPLNGSLQTSIKNSGIANQIHYKTIQGDDDDHNNKASTYLLSKGYRQELSENTGKLTYGVNKKMDASQNIMQVAVVDKITFPNGQAYLDTGDTKDELYHRFVGSLQKTIDGNTSAEQFPSGTTGTASFYVYKMNGDTKTYYKYNRTTKTWEDVGTDEKVATSYTWTSDGGNMELPLADGTVDNVISLQGVRALVRGTNTTDDSTFYVEVRMDAAIPAAGLDVIPESEELNGAPVDYVKFTYSSQLSTEKTSLSYSTNRATANKTQTAYYREEPEGVKLTYDADQLGQLGINLLDLQYLDTSEQHSLIDTTALYDLSSMKNLDNTLKNSTGIKFTLSLSPKNTDSNAGQEDYQSATEEAAKYLSVELKSKDSGSVDYEKGTWTWTVPKETYWKDDNVNTDSVFNGSILTQAIQLKVNVDNIEDGGIQHFYSNYKVTLTAQIEGVAVESESDNIIYTLAKIKPEFVEPTSTN